MPDTYYLRIKKDYAADVIKDLQKMEAVEFITDDNIDIPQWQIDAVRATKEKVDKDPSLLKDWDTVKQQFKNR